MIFHDSTSTKKRDHYITILPAYYVTHNCIATPYLKYNQNTTHTMNFSRFLLLTALCLVQWSLIVHAMDESISAEYEKDCVKAVCEYCQMSEYANKPGPSKSRKPMSKYVMDIKSKCDECQHLAMSADGFRICQNYFISLDSCEKVDLEDGEKDFRVCVEAKNFH